jgi:hypothetical protein
MTENEPGGEGARHEHRNPRKVQTKKSSAKGTAEELDQRNISIKQPKFALIAVFDLKADLQFVDSLFLL